MIFFNADLQEQEVKCVESTLSPPEKVQQAMDCVQSSEKILINPKLSFRRWTILDYSRAYASREITPRTVCHFATIILYDIVVSGSYYMSCCVFILLVAFTVDLRIQIQYMNMFWVLFDMYLYDFSQSSS